MIDMEADMNTTQDHPARLSNDLNRVCQSFYRSTKCLAYCTCNVNPEACLKHWFLGIKEEETTAGSCSSKGLVSINQILPTASYTASNYSGRSSNLSPACINSQINGQALRELQVPRTRSCRQS